MPNTTRVPYLAGEFAGESVKIFREYYVATGPAASLIMLSRDTDSKA